MKKQFLWLVMLIFCLCPMMTKAQIFMPIISYYNSFTYHYGMQNWCCTQDDRGIMYFANNNGVLSFDGYSWRTIALPSKGLVRSILADGDRIYVGSYTDFGYLCVMNGVRWCIILFGPKNISRIMTRYGIS